MTIVPLKKYLFIGAREDFDVFFARAQEKGFIEFLSTQKQQLSAHYGSVEEALKALKILRAQPSVKQAKTTKDLDPKILIETILTKEAALHELRERERFLQGERARIAPLGDFDLQAVRALERETGRSVQFFCIRQAKLRKLELDEQLIPVGSAYDMDYFMAIAPKTVRINSFIELHFDLSLGEIEKEIEKIEQKQESCRQELHQDAAYIDYLQSHLTALLDKHHLGCATNATRQELDGSLFTVEGWLPQNRLPTLFPLLEGLAIHAEEIAIEEGERTPTCMENKSYGKVGEDLVHIYDTPAPEDRDPSKWVFWAFAIFFAMIISDAGYGAIFLGLALFLRKKYPHVQGMGKRFLRLFTVLSTCCIGWGILSASYFGLEIPPDHPINRVNIIHKLAVKKADYHVHHRDETYREVIKEFPELFAACTGEELLVNAKVEKNGFTKYTISDDFRDSIFMEIALIVGVIHIGLSLLRRVRNHWAGAGWVLAMGGAYLFFPKILGATSAIYFLFPLSKEVGYRVGEQLFWCGIGSALVLALIQNKWRGLIEITKIIELFADVLSYLRLYALGLAAMILAGTFNEMGANLGFVAGFFVILIGHAINITVGIMGGTIHGLRLNFIEWYHHSFEGGGKLFNPLKLMKSRGE